MLNGVTTRMDTSSWHDALRDTVANTVKFDAMIQYLAWLTRMSLRAFNLP
jgi:hypothetical protein